MRESETENYGTTFSSHKPVYEYFEPSEITYIQENESMIQKKIATI